MTTVPLPIPYMTRPTIMVVKLVLCIERATRILPRVIKTVVRMEPDTVPKASRYNPPSTGNTVLTIETLDWITPYCELLIPNSFETFPCQQ